MLVIDKRQLFAVLASTIGAISDGMQYGWTAPYQPILTKPDSPIAVSKSDIAWLESIYMIGGVAGLPVTIYCVDKIGRKKSILMAAITSFIAWILISIANNVIYLYVARFMTGLAGDVAFVAAPMYIAEIADKQIRGLLAGVIYIMMLVGILLVYAIAPYAPIYVTSIVGAAFTVIQLVTFPLVPDSPYYLLSKGKYDKAKAHLARLRSDDNIDKELEEIASAVKRQKSEKGRPQDLFISKSNRKAIIIMTVLNAAQHFSSISVILMSLHSILLAAKSTYISFQMAGILFSAIMLVAACVADFTVDKFGRKSLLISSSLATGVCLLILAIYFTLQKNQYDVDSISWIPVAALMVYAATFKCGLGIIPIVMTAELFPAKVKAMGMTLADLAYVAFSLISIEIYEELISVYYFDIPFYIFASSTLLAALFSWLYIPETKGKTLEEIQFILKGESPPEPNRNWKLETIENGLEEKPKTLEASNEKAESISTRL